MNKRAIYETLNKRPASFVLGLLLSLLTACSGDAFKWPTSTQNSITGSVIPFGGVVSLRGLTGTSTCPTATAHLYAVDSSGTKTLPALQTVPLNSDGTYTFSNLRQLGIRVKNVNQLTGNYIVEVTGCNAGYSRLLTATNKQDVNWGTTLVSYITYANQPGAASVDRTKLEELYKALDVHGDFDSAYGDLTTVPAVTNKFQSVLGANPVVLEDASPMLVTLNAPTGVSEGSTTAIALTAVQWQSTFQYAFRWEVDGTPIANTPSLSYTPSGNMQGPHALTVKWGKDDGFGNLDTTKPYQVQSVPFWVSDNVPVTAPLISAVPANVNSPNVNLQLQTGVGLANCDSFSGLAITEDVPVAPVNPALYSLTCSTAPTQNVPVVLSGGLGTHTLYLWAMDAAGNISAASTATVNYNNAVPPITIASPLATDPPYSGSVTVTGACEDVSGDVTLSGGITPSPQLAACSGGAYSRTVNFTAGDGAKTINAAQTNMFGTTGTATVSVTNDTTAPTVSLTSTAPNFTNVAAFPVTVTFSEAVTGFLAGDVVVGNGTISAFSGSGTTYTFTITSSGQGAVSVDVPAGVAIDVAGNANLGGTLSRTYDTLQPSVTIATTAANPTHLSTVPITVTFSESVTGFSLASLSLTNATASSLAGSGTSYTFNVLPTAQGAFSVQIGAAAASDSAGNTSTASNTISSVFDNVQPSATLTTTAPTPTRNSPIPYQVVFSEAVTGFALSDLTLVNGTASNLVGSGTTYTFDVTPAGQGTVSALVPANSAQDSATNGNTASATVGVIYDSVAPPLTISSPTVGQGTNLSTMTFTGACEDGLPISITGAGLSSPSSTTCSSGTYSQVITFTAGDDTKNISLTQTDVAGNTTTVSRAVPYDTVPPSMIFASVAVQNQITNTNTVTFNGSCESGITVTVSGADTGSTTCVGSMWSYTTATQSTDATRSYTFTQTDPGGNAVSIIGSWERDTVAPGLTRTSPANGTHAQSSVTVTGACQIGLPIDFTGTGLVSDLHPNCTTGTYSQTVFFSSGDGTKNITMSQTDAAGNVTSIALSFVRDNVGPVLTQTLHASPWWTNTNSTSFGGACETGQTINVDVDGSPEGTAACAAGTWTYTTGTQTTDATRTYTFTQVDTANNSTSINVQWVRRTTNPALTITSTLARLTATNTVTFTGTCMTGVNVVVSGADSSSTTCSGGTWSYTTAAQTTNATRTYNFRQTDLAGNFTQVSDTWQRDDTLPNLTITTSLPVINNSNNATFSGACDNAYPVVVSGAESTSVTCSGSAWTFTASQTVDGSYTYNFRQTAPSTAYTQVTGVWTRDTVAPGVSSFLLNGGAAIVNITYAKVAMNASDAATKITHFCLKNANSAPGAGDSCWIPVNASPPGLTPAQTLNLSNFSYYLGITPGTYNIYGWVRDAAGNISTNAGSSGVDTDSIAYNVIYPPVMDTVFATNTSAPGYPVPSPQLSVNAGQMIYIKWRASPGSGSTFGATPMRLSFTTDDLNWSTIATVANSSNGGCALTTSAADSGVTGCYNWSSPTSGFIRVKIESIDTDGRTSALSPPPLNTGTFKLVAGSTNPGINSSTLASIYTFRRQPLRDWGDFGAFVINSNGVLYLNDHAQGILTVDPNDGLTRVLVPKTGTTSGDGPVNNATVRNVLTIALDYQDRLLVWDNDQIRRIDFTTNTITRIIGGGTQTGPALTSALDMQFEGYMPLPTSDFDTEFAWRSARLTMIPLPNGDLYFGSRLDPWINPVWKFRRYREGANPELVTVTPTGFGHSGGSGANIANCSIQTYGFDFDPATSVINAISMAVAEHADGGTSCLPNGGHATNHEMYVYEAVLDANWQTKPVQPANGTPVANSWSHYQRVTGRNGKMYAYRRGTGQAYVRDTATGVWTHIMGTGALGQCPDNTLATSCDMDLQDMFVTAQGQIFVLDGGRVRVMDNTGRLVTVFGQSRTAGNGGDPTIARFSYLWGLGLGTDNRVMVYDAGTIREVSADRSVISLVAGGGRDGWSREGETALGGPFLSGSHNYRGSIMLYPGTNNPITTIMDTSGRGVMGMLNRATGLWETLVPYGTTPYPSADGLPGASVMMGVWGDGINHRHDGFLPLGFGNGKLLITTVGYPNGVLTHWQNGMLKTYNSADSWRQAHLAGYTGSLTDGSQFCPNGTSVNSCQMPVNYQIAASQYDSVDNKWLLLSNHGDNFGSSRIVSVADNVDNNVTPRTVNTFATLPRNPGGFQYWRTGGHEYIYYCGYSNGNIYRYDVTTSTEVQLILPSSTMKCSPQNSLSLDKVNGVLYFNFQQNNLHAVGSITAI